MESLPYNISLQPYVTLNNGIRMPQIGLGTFLSSEADVYPIVKSAILEYGYRHIDTAMFYNNEEAIGTALQECFAQGIKREDIFITTKLHYSEKNDVESAFKRSLQKLKLDYIDLYLIHWPIPKLIVADLETPFLNTPIHKVWPILEKQVEAGLIKSIGISNFAVPMLLDLLAYAKIKPVMNQVEIHPYFIQKDFIDFH
jgi:diketogulonate reductase-like aldo/keto reductase